jgi:glycosyltransferase 2 family protein
MEARYLYATSRPSSWTVITCAGAAIGQALVYRVFPRRVKFQAICPQFRLSAGKNAACVAFFRRVKVRIADHPIDVSSQQPRLQDIDAAAGPPRRWSPPRVTWTLVRLAVGIGLLAYLVISRVIDLRALSKLITAWPISLAALALMFLDITLMALRLSWLFRPSGLRLSFSNSLELTLVSSFFATFLPGAAGGDLAKLYYAASENKGRRTEIVTVVIFDRVIGLFSLLLLPLFFAPLFPDLIYAVPVLRALLITSLALAIGLLLALLIFLFYPALATGLARMGPGFLSLEKLAQRIAVTLATYRRSPGTLLAALALSLLANLSLIAITALAILILHPISLSMKMALVIPLGDLANNLPITPGGLGVGESAYNALFRAVGLVGGAEALLAWRIWRAAVGLIGLLLYLRGPGRAVYEGNSSIEK